MDLYAGYRDNDGACRIFSGSVIRTVTTDEGMDVKTEIQASDGQVAVRDSVFALSYAPGTAGSIIVMRKSSPSRTGSAGCATAGD